MSLFQPAQVPISVKLPPTGPQGARMIGPIQLQFTQTAGGSNVGPIVSDDLIIEGEDGAINNVQSIFYDNSQNPGTVIFTLGDTQQALILPPHTQGYLPIQATNSLRWSAQNYGGLIGSVNFSFSFMNVPVEPHVWQSVPSTLNIKMSMTNVQNAGNTAINLAVPGVTIPNKLFYVHGIEVIGTGATAETFITINLTNIVSFSSDIGGHTQSWGADVPVLGAGSLNFQRTFNPPFRSLSAANASGFIATAPVLTCPAMGAGQTGASAAIYFSFE